MTVSRWGLLGVAVLALLSVLFAALWWLSPTHDASTVVAAFWHGSLGTTSAFFSGTLVRAIPLALLGAGLCVAFRAGVFNIGGEGQLMIGAVAATFVGLGHSLGPLHVVIALVAGAAGGAAWAAIAAELRRRFGVLEVISTIMLNFIAASLVAYLVRGPLQEPTGVYPQTELVEVPARLVRLLPDFRLHAGIFIAVIVCAAAWWFLRETAAGFRVRAVGASPSAAAIIGRVDVPRVTFGALVASGALAGLAGGVEVTGVTYALYENISPGYGFSAIAVAILAGLRPAFVPLSALLFATLETGALGMQRDAGIPSVVASALEAVVILATLVIGAGFLRRTALPASTAP
ncbi:MAG: ABC transporter permease [Gemmatimonadota bacterium]